MISGKILIGTATCGIASGAQKSLDKIKLITKNLEIVEVGCIGSCYLEPIIGYEYNDEIYLYKNITEDKVEKLISYLNQNNLTNELLLSKKSELNNHEFFRKQTKRVSKNCGYIDPESINDYVKSGGLIPLNNALKLSPQDLIEYVKNSGIRGRGGAGFLTGQKWSFIAKKQGIKFLVINADEGDPGAFMNRSLMEGDPFRILEGMIIAAYATGATKGIVYVRAEKPLAAKRMKNAVIKLRRDKYLGQNILNKGFSFDIEVRLGAGAFVCGEETALINSIMGERGMPRLRPPYPADSGIDNHPTNVNNVETYAQITTLFELGLAEFIKLGTPLSKGTKTFSITGKVRRQGMIEVPLGTSLKEIIFDIAGGTEKKFKAAQIGGPSGGCLPLAELDVPVDYESLRTKGTHIGSGGIVVIDEDNSMISLAKFFLNFTQQESCGKCTPCREGTKRMFEILEKIEDGKATKIDIDNLIELSNVVTDTALCGLGQASSNPILSTLRYFKPEYDAYLQKSFEYFIMEDSCTFCKKCITSCPVKIILEQKHTKLDKKIAFINQDKCIHCGVCFKVCPTHAILKKPRVIK